MLQIPRLALYNPHPEDARYITACFPREDYSIRIVHSPQEILDFVGEEQSPFDAIVTPPKGDANDGGLLFITQVRATPDLERTPIVALTEDSGSQLILALYEAGANVVIQPPFNSRIILSQINALYQFRATYERLITEAFELGGLRTSTTKALNCVREGIVLFDPHRVVNFLNTSAGQMLGIAWDTPAEIIDRLSTQFNDFVAQHESHALAAGELTTRDPVSELPMSVVRTQVQRSGGSPFLALIRAISLIGDHGEFYGTALAICDLGEFATLTAHIQQTRRTRSLCLAAAAACLRLARGTAPIKTASASALFHEISELEEAQCSLPTVTTAFLEILDLMIPQSVQVKVSLHHEGMLAVRPGDLFQILGHLVLEGVDFCGVGGTIEISTSEMPELGSVRLTVTADSTRVIPPVPADHFAALLQGATSLPEENAEVLPHGLSAAREILKRYGETPVTQERPTPFSLILRVLLPQKVTSA